MQQATLTSKGQTTIPIKIREFLGLKSGDRLDFVIRDDGDVLLKPAQLDVMALKGILKRPGQKPTSVEEMNHAIVKRLGRKFKRK